MEKGSDPGCGFPLQCLGFWPLGYPKFSDNPQNNIGKLKLPSTMTVVPSDPCECSLANSLDSLGPSFDQKY